MRIKIKFKNRKGVSPVIELVFVLPILIGLVFAILYSGIVGNQMIALTNAAREGVRTFCIEANNPQADPFDDAYSVMQQQIVGTAIDFNKMKNGTTFTRTAIWNNGQYQPDNTVITPANLSNLHFHDKVEINIQYQTLFDSIFLGVFHPVLHAKSEYLVEYMY